MNEFASDQAPLGGSARKPQEAVLSHLPKYESQCVLVFVSIYLTKRFDPQLGHMNFLLELSRVYLYCFIGFDVHRFIGLSPYVIGTKPMNT